MEYNSNERGYTKEDLKINPTAIKKRLVPEYVEEPLEEKEISALGSLKVVTLLVFGYILYAILPSLFFIYILDTGFVIAELLTFVLAVLLVLAFGLHKEASPEQLAKRDMHKRK